MSPPCSLKYSSFLPPLVPPDTFHRGGQMRPLKILKAITEFQEFRYAVVSRPVEKNGKDLKELPLNIPWFLSLHLMLVVMLCID